jgi:HAD superfamily hydrolase (TIGR01509 family)
LNDLKAVIFDMDGLLLDSERISLSTFVAACRECNFDPDPRVYYRCIGTTYGRAKEILQDGYGPAFPLAAIAFLWEKKYAEEQLNSTVPLKTGVLNLLKYLGQKGLKKAVVTSTYKENALRKLANAGILSYFELVLTGDEITSPKPDPEIYLAACRMLKEAPANCLALEDSDAGVLAAFSAGVMVIQVPDLLDPSAEVKALHHPIVKTLKDVETILRKCLS